MSSDCGASPANARTALSSRSTVSAAVPPAPSAKQARKALLPKRAPSTFVASVTPSV